MSEIYNPGVVKLTSTGGTITISPPSGEGIVDIETSGGGGSLTITDGVNTVTGTTQITVTGGTVGGTTPNATLLVTSSVSSVFGRTGAVTAQSGDYVTSQVTESGNLYFTNARAIASTLTGFAAGAGTVSATDSVLSAFQKVVGNIAALVTGVSSVFGRTGAVVATTGDYAYTNITGAAGGPASATSGNLPSFNGTGGKLLQDSGVAAANVVLLTGAQTITGAKFFNSTLQVALPTTNAVVIGNITGNARGNNSLDVQSARSSVTQVANGSSAGCFGANNTASNTYSFALGYGNNVTGASNAGVGVNNNTSLVFDTAFGYQNTSSGSYSCSVGSGNTSSGYASTTSGYGNTASGRYATAVGRAAKATGNFATAVGASQGGFDTFNHTASGYYSVVVGSSCLASQTKSIAIGANVTNNTANTVMIGTSDTLKIIFNSTGFQPLGSNYLAVDGTAGVTGSFTAASIASLSARFKNGLFVGVS